MGKFFFSLTWYLPFGLLYATPKAPARLPSRPMGGKLVHRGKLRVRRESLVSEVTR